MVDCPSVRGFSRAVFITARACCSTGLRLLVLVLVMMVLLLLLSLLMMVVLLLVLPLLVLPLLVLIRLILHFPSRLCLF